MALTRTQKETAVSDLTELLERSKIIVFANYRGLKVGESQALRALARENNCQVLVTKNRLVKIALSNVEGYKDASSIELKDQLVYGFGFDDEVTPAQVFANFAKEHPSLELLGAIDCEGQILNTISVKQLASLPSKEVLHAQLVGTIAAPLSGLQNVLLGNIRGLLNVLNATANKS